MNPGIHNIAIQQGASFSLRFRFKDSDGNPINMTGHSVYAEMWTLLKTEKLADFVITWVNRAQGDFTINLAGDVTRLIDREGKYDILVVNPDGTSDYWVRGRAALERGYTE